MGEAPLRVALRPSVPSSHLSRERNGVVSSKLAGMKAVTHVTDRYPI